MQPARSVTDGVYVLPSYIPVPGLGLLPANAFVIDADEPLLVDTGLALDDGAFLAELGSILDPADLRWLWLTHVDPDHIGNLVAVLEAAPRARIVTNFIGAGKLNLVTPVPLERFYLVNPGQLLNVGGHRLAALRPPCFDAPETMGFYDHDARALFSADCFGALVPAPLEDARELSAASLAAQQRLWATVDAPWLEMVDPDLFARSLEPLRALGPELVLSSHLPMARDLFDRLLDNLLGAVGTPPFVGPDQQALRAAAQSQSPAVPTS
jgi:flavorubredoxin